MEMELILNINLTILKGQMDINRNFRIKVIICSNLSRMKTNNINKNRKNRCKNRLKSF